MFDRILSVGAIILSLVAIISVANVSGGNLGGGPVEIDQVAFVNGFTAEADVTLEEGTFLDDSGTTTVTINGNSVGGCFAVEQADGSGYGYFYADSTGSLATSTSCE